MKSVRRKASRMNTLLSAIFKFCTTNQPLLFSKAKCVCVKGVHGITASEVYFLVLFIPHESVWAKYYVRLSGVFRNVLRAGEKQSLSSILLFSRGYPQILDHQPGIFVQTA